MKTASILLISVMAALSSCSGSDATDAELKASREAGQRHAEAALAYPENSMDREKAILGIRARETRMRDAGFEACADAYIESATQTFKSSTRD